MQTEQIIQQLINSWSTQNKNVDTFFAKYNDDTYLKEIAPGKNTAIYLFGHLIAVSDSMLVMFGLGEKLYPELEEMFLTNPDKVITNIPSINELKGYWQKVNDTLQDHFNKMSAGDWLGRHTRVSEEDFAKDPLRNKLNVLISRTGHQGYHLGQLNLLKDN